MVRKPRPRRGVLLLVVLSILVLFALIGITFVVVASGFKRTAKQAARIGRAGEDDPRSLLDGAMYQLVRGPRDLRSGSSMFGHSLLRDLYGNDGFTGTINSATNAGGASGNPGQFMDLRLTPTQYFCYQPSINGPKHLNSPGFYAGCVFTMVDGPAAGYSTRIVLHDGYAMRVEAFQTDLNRAITTSDLGNYRFVVNGRPFNGTGAGFNGTNISTVALQPNYTQSAGGNANLITRGGCDESYDAVDFQNMFLAMVRTVDLNASGQATVEVIPSFHRPALVRQSDSLTSLRPTNPRFTRANDPRGFTPRLGPWDVDNDADGILDSVWIDLGYPPRATVDGQMYKPLFAILCVDMDGRVNVNAHGNTRQQGDVSGYNINRSWLAGTPANVSTYPTGDGFGPAEIDPGNVISRTEMTAIYQARYGTDGSPGTAGQDDPLNPYSYKNQGMPANYVTAPPSAYGDWPDVWGVGMRMLDKRGQPLRFRPTTTASQTVDDPYEINLSRPDGRDTPFNAAELERLLRYYDPDVRTASPTSSTSSPSSRPPRLLDIASVSLGNGGATASPALTRRNRAAVTTHSFDIPVANVQMPRELRGTVPPSPYLGDIFVARGATAAQLRTLMPFEFYHGQKMNLNRLFGDGQTISTRNIVNDPLYPTYKNNDDPLPGATGTVSVNPRQIYARNLYCLAMALMDRNYTDPLISTGASVTGRQELTARRVAQWAVNVVDFRDPDAIMTPFEYDLTPFTGWDPRADGVLIQGERTPVVWGCEAPDLIMTETVAFHDRGVKDTDNADPSNPQGDRLKRNEDGTYKSPPEPGDPTLDQYLAPQGSLFVELYCPHNNATSYNNPQVPTEMYTIDANGNASLRLGKGIGGSPIWRIAVAQRGAPSVELWARTKPDSVSFQPEDMDLRNNGGTPKRLVSGDLYSRLIYFTTLVGAAPGARPQTGIYSGRSSSPELLPAGGYAVIGPRTTTYIGEKTGGGLPRHRITLKTTSIEVIDGEAPQGVTEPTLGTLPIVGIIAEYTGSAKPIGVSVSEPLPNNYYSQRGDSTTRKINPPVDVPFDSTQNDFLRKSPKRLATGTYDDFTTAFLQRLADPAAPYNATTNPYLTVDWMPIDLTVFNGSDKKPSDWPAAAGDFDKDDPNMGTPAADKRVYFGSRRRGLGPAAASLPAERANIWPPFSVSPTLDVPALNARPEPPGSSAILPYRLRHTLGYLNSAVLGNIGRLSTPLGYEGAPDVPFPWITWNNRPFANHLELLNVPSSSPGRLFFEFKIGDPNRGRYSPPSGTTSQPPYLYPFGHLLNFFRTSANTTGSSTTGSSAPQFYRLLDFVEVPSPYVGTETWYSGSAAEEYTYKTPFNQLSTFRDPGKINLNTIFDVRVMNALMQGYPEFYTPVDTYGNPSSAGTNTFWYRFQRSRRGYQTEGIAGGVATQFANPFRSAASADLVPSGAAPQDTLLGPVDVTLLRSDPSQSAGFDRYKPLFAVQMPSTGSGQSTYYNDSRRNAFFRYQGIGRLGNMVTTHSNVFAVWITVGRFEWDPSAGGGAGTGTGTGNGNELGREVGLETGNVQRHRAFYIIDRSIPVAFEPGENHNVDRAVILRRFIE